MSSEKEHQILAAIRDWISSTADIEIPVGLDRGEARGRAEELLANLACGLPTVESDDLNDDLKDILWACVELLRNQGAGEATFDVCDRLYRFTSALSIAVDPFDEQEDLLNLIAIAGWRCVPEQLAASAAARDRIFEHGDSTHHRQVCETADTIPTCIDRFRKQDAQTIGEAQELCARVFRLASIRPDVVVRSAPVLYTHFRAGNPQAGRLDDLEYLKGAVSLAESIAGRQLGNWPIAEMARRRSASAFRRTADRSAIDRVRSEQLALLYARGKHHAVCDLGPSLAKNAVIPRERFKAQGILASAQLNLGRSTDAKAVLEALRSDPISEQEPALKAWVLTKLGTALSYLGSDAEALEAFKCTASTLADFDYPLQSADLTASLGEHFANVGKLNEAFTLYAAAREKYRAIGQAQLVGYLDVLMAELMMMLGRNEEAEAKLAAAIPLIEKLDLRREALAAVALLTESLAKRHADARSIRDPRDEILKGPRS